MTKLHVAAEADVAAAATALEWAGRTSSATHEPATSYCRRRRARLPSPTGTRRPAALAVTDWLLATRRRFVLTDGRNRFIASLMLGVEHMLVSWLVLPER